MGAGEFSLFRFYKPHSHAKNKNPPPTRHHYHTAKGGVNDSQGRIGIRPPEGIGTQKIRRLDLF